MRGEIPNPMIFPRNLKELYYLLNIIPSDFCLPSNLNSLYLEGSLLPSNFVFPRNLVELSIGYKGHINLVLNERLKVIYLRGGGISPDIKIPPDCIVVK